MVPSKDMDKMEQILIQMEMSDNNFVSFILIYQSMLP